MTEAWNGKHAQRSVKEWAEAWDERYKHHGSSRASRPEGLYKEGRGWLRRGMQRQRPAVVTALLVSWTGLWLAPWGIVIGGLVGMLAAGGFATGWAVEHHLYEVGAGCPGSSFLDRFGPE